MATQPTPKAVYQRFIQEVLVCGNLTALDELVAADVVSHAPFPGQAPGREGFKQAFSQFRAAFPELRVKVHDVLADGSKVVGYFTVSGVHRGELFGIPATGKAVSYDEVAIVRIEEGKIVEHWSVADSLSLMQQLGAVAA